MRINFIANIYGDRKIMKMNKILIAGIVLILGIGSVVFGQKTDIKKFDFMKGEFKTRGNEGMVKADFDKSGKMFRWEYNGEKIKNTGLVTFDEKSKNFYLMETSKGLNIKYYKGFETTDGFHFYQLNGMNGIVDAAGEEILLRPLDKGMVQLVRYRFVTKDRKCKSGFVSEYYDKNFTAPQIAGQTRQAIKKLDFLAGTFTEDARTGQVIGKYEDNGMKYVWTFTSPRNTSEAAITYDFHNDEYTLTETVGFGNSKTTTKYVGRFDNDGKLNLISTESDTVLGLVLSQPNKNKVLMQRTKDTVENYKGTYTRVP
jgi:hypothetical protein